MFIDAQYQPHSSSVRVRALAALSPTTPTHLALPPHRAGENPGAAAAKSAAAATLGLLIEDSEWKP